MFRKFDLRKIYLCVSVNISFPNLKLHGNCACVRVCASERACVRVRVCARAVRASERAIERARVRVCVQEYKIHYANTFWLI